MNQEQVCVIELMDKASESKQDFLNYIGHFHYEQSQEYEEAEFLIRNQDDIAKWIEFWDGDPDNVIETNKKLRQWKIELFSGHSYEEFSDLLAVDPTDFVETYFQQRCGKRIMHELNLLLNRIDVRQLYYIHSKFPMVRVESI